MKSNNALVVLACLANRGPFRHNLACCVCLCVCVCVSLCVSVCIFGVFWDLHRTLDTVLMALKPVEVTKTLVEPGRTRYCRFLRCARLEAILCAYTQCYKDP